MLASGNTQDSYYPRNICSNKAAAISDGQYARNILNVDPETPSSPTRKPEDPLDQLANSV